MLDLEGHLLSMNENGRLLMGVPDLCMVLQKNWASFWKGEGHHDASRALAACRAGETAKFEGFCQTFDEQDRWWEVVVSPIKGEDGKPSKILVVSRDITEKKIAETQLRNSELRYRNLFEQNPLAAWIYNKDTLEILDVNQMAISRYGYSFEQFLRLKVSDIRLCAEHEPIERELRNENTGKKRSGPWHHRLKDGSVIVVELITQTIDWLQIPARLVMVHDISEKVASEEKFRCLFEKSSDAILLTCGGEVIDCNPRTLEMLGTESKDCIAGMTLLQLLAAVQPDGTPGEDLYAAMRGPGDCPRWVQKELLHRRLDGEEFLVDLSMTEVEINGRQMRLVIWHDLTESKRAEAAVRRSEARLREAQQIARLGNWEFDSATECVEWSDETYRIFGMVPGLPPLSTEEIGKRIHPADRHRVLAQRRRAMEEDAPYDVEFRVVWSSGEIRYVHSRGQRYLSHSGIRARLAGTILDVTEQRRIDEALRASEARFQAFMDNSPALAFIKDREGRMVYMNRICQTMWNLQGVDWQGKTDAELWSPELAQEFRKMDSAVLDSGVARAGVSVVPLPGGELCSLLTYKFPLNLFGGERLLGGISIDISGQREAERKTLAALADKEVLIQEVHHRVKNNLQVICSLLEMQAAGLDDARTITALHESRDRVQSMAMIHELLYGSKTLSDINFLDYAERLVGELAISYGSGSRIRLRIDVAPMNFSINRAIPCGLILNELISNALKYAFPGERAGEVVISLAEHGTDYIALAVRDDGAGLPVGFRMETARSLGLRIVQILVKQLDGQLRMESHNGTCFEILLARVPAELPALNS